MLDLAILQVGTNLPADQLPDASTAQLIKATSGGLITLAAVRYAGQAARRAIMGHLLPDDMAGVDTNRVTTDRDPRALAVTALAYALGVGLTAAAVYLLAGLPWALAWTGAWALLAAAVALLAARDASPIDDVRLLAEARRQG